MLINASDVADTLRLLVPGFLATPVFYWFGLRTKRSEWEWVIWSLLAAVPVNAVAFAIAGRVHITGDWRLALALVLGLILGTILIVLWRLFLRVLPQAARGIAIRAWDDIFGRPTSQWVQIKMLDGTVATGWSMYAAQSVDTDDLDVYIREPTLLQAGNEVALPGVEGILVARSQVAWMMVFEQPDETPPPTRATWLRLLKSKVSRRTG